MNHQFIFKQKTIQSAPSDRVQNTTARQRNESPAHHPKKLFKAHLVTCDMQLRSREMIQQFIFPPKRKAHKGTANMLAAQQPPPPSLEEFPKICENVSLLLWIGLRLLYLLFQSKMHL